MFYRRSDKPSGMTLVEVLVAVAIGGILTTVMLTMFTVSRKSYTTQDYVAEMQQNLRVAMQYVSRDIRQAGCGFNLMAELVPNIQVWNDNYNGGDWALLNPFTAFNSAAGPDSVDIVYGNIQSGEYSAIITDDMPAPSSELNVDEPEEFSIGDFCVVTDGNYSFLMQITTVQVASSKIQHNSGESDWNCSNPKFVDPSFGGFPAGSRVYNFGDFVWLTYSIDNITDPNQPRLVVDRHDGLGNQVVAENVEDMQIHYFMADGSETDNPAGSEDDIRAVRLSIVGRTSQQDMDNQTFMPIALEDNNPAAVPDGYRRMILSSTIQVRNLGT